MVFSSLSFLCLFLPLVLALYFCRREIKWKNGVLLAFSLIFYGWSDPVWILAMLFSTFLNYFCALKIESVQKVSVRRAYLVFALAGSLGLLFYFKYAAFTVNGFLSVFGAAARVKEKTLPIGISFYTFQTISYTLDVYWEKVSAQKKPARLLLYVCCFPQLIAGPIVRYSDVEKKLKSRYTSPDDFSQGMRRFIVGLSKKVLLANLFGQALEKTYLAGGGTPLSIGGAWLSAFLYALQIYFDFSAYSDMAIGLGRVFGFRYRENFDYPYLSRSAGEFWRRWHISLGTWFREYLMYPLMRSSPIRRLSMRKSTRHSKMFYRNLATILCTMIVWTCTGLWHGASWNFVVWGVYYGLMMVLEKFVFEKILSRTPGVVRWFLTMLVALFSFVIFYYTDFSRVGEHILAMLGVVSENGLRAAALIDESAISVLKSYGVLMAVGVVCCLPVGKWLSERVHTKALHGAQTVFLTVLMILSVLFLVGQSYNPFIYFRF